ncbi:MAG: U32 family peptidase [Clostridiales bacterium]|nr:U32 family peptidase [Clostridiales bacterium]
MAAGVDAIVLGDIGLLYYTRGMRLPVSLHASIFFHAINREQVSFFRAMDVDRLCLFLSCDD